MVAPGGAQRNPGLGWLVMLVTTGFGRTLSVIPAATVVKARRAFLYTPSLLRDTPPWQGESFL